MPDHQQAIKILHLEDSPYDAELVQDRLVSGGLACDIVLVNNQERFVSALANGSFDLILCDYNLPDYDGVSALEMVRRKHPLIPVILISGSLGEEEAVKCLQYGGTDYLLKQRLERLPTAVNRALVEAEGRRQRRQAEQLLRESEERFRQLAQHSSEGFWFLALNPQRVLYVSPAVEKIWGMPAERFYQDATAGWAAIHAEDVTRVHDALDDCLQGRSSRFETEYRVVRLDGSVRWVLDSGTPIHDETGEIVRVSGVARDITERKEVESQMLRAQRLESIGTLASGVAHDLNNALAPIMMATELLQLAFPDQASQHLELIQSSAKRAADMVRQLLTFAKGAEGERLLVQPRHLLKEMETLIKGSFPKNIQLRTNYANDLGTILGDATQLHQVLLNLCVNARDAMPNGGTLTVKAENIEIDSIYARAIPGAKPGQYVAWRIEDTGTGIPPEILDRIFEPFFTTKGPEKGTGLGLSTVIGIVKGHGGFVRVYSRPAQGSSFSVYLPAAETGASDPDFRAKSEPPFKANGETILVVDDEAALLDILRTILTSFNFKVLTASSGTTALLDVAEKRAELRVVITDMHMPGMDGLSFVKLLKGKLPGVGVIVTSGRLDEEEANEFHSLGVNALLDKPFTQEKLVTALKTVFPA